MPYAALHARIELEMLVHPCGRTAAQNLTSILQQVKGLLAEETQQSTKGLFIAVSRSGVSAQDGEQRERYRLLKDHADDNVRTLNNVVRGFRPKGLPPVFECGEKLVQDYYQTHPNSIIFGSILESMINFYIAVESEIFVGFRHSSFSKSVWATRYHQGKGSSNYEYTRDEGIKPIENGGLPKPHENCPR